MQLKPNKSEKNALTNSLESDVQNEQEQAKNPPRKNIISQLSKLFILFILLNLGIEFFRFLGSIVSCDLTKSYNSEAKHFVSSMNRAQQAYYLEKSAFARSINSLEVGIKSQTTRFDYSIRTTQNAAFSYGVSRQDAYEKAYWGVFSWNRPVNYQIRSYVGGIFVVPAANSTSENTTEMVSIICESEPGVTKVAEPFLQDGVPTCSEGMKGFNF